MFSIRCALKFVSATAASLAVSFGSGCSTAPAVYATPEAAVNAAIAGVRADDDAALKKVFGSEAKKLIDSGDPVADQENSRDFLAKYDEKHKLVAGEEGSLILEVGNDAWPMPIPLVKGDKGWYFDTAAGMDEILTRRIGRNELDTIETCRAIVDAQKEYRALNPRKSPKPEYASRVISTEGNKDGLYWPTPEGAPQSPLGDVVAEAIEEGYGGKGRGAPFHGYYYRLLTSQGAFAPGGVKSYTEGGFLTHGFALVAWPAQYGNSGIMTFITNHQGIVYQRDLGKDTNSAAAQILEFNPDPQWTVVE